MQIFWMLGVVLIASFVLSRTKFGYHVYATGDNELAARNAGIDTRRVKLLCFVIVGALAGLAASILIGWVHGVSRGYGPGYELDVIAAVVIHMAIENGYPPFSYDTGAEVVDASNIGEVVEREAQFEG